MILEAEKITKLFSVPEPFQILKGVDLKVKKGESVAIMGRSGEGKSTLLHILGSLDSATTGQIKICGQTVNRFNQNKLRLNHLGFIFQSFHLLEDFTVESNVSMPAWIARANRVEIDELLDQVGLLHRKNHLAKTLSGGEKQRVAIARALCNNPDLILADEPTGNLDHQTAAQIQKLLIQSAKKLGKALIVVTHSKELADLSDRSYSLQNGQLKAD